MILITGHAQIRPDSLAKALELGIEHSRRSRAEPGCLAHNCHVDAEDANRIVFVEEWTDMAAVQAHFAVPESGAFVRAIGAMSEAAPVMRIWNCEEVSANASGG